MSSWYFSLYWIVRGMVWCPEACTVHKLNVTFAGFCAQKQSSTAVTFPSDAVHPMPLIYMHARRPLGLLQSARR